MHRLALVLPAVLALSACDGGRTSGAGPVGPSLYITSPRMDQVIEGHEVSVMFDLRHYPIGKVDEGGNGQHVHLIVDNEPYVAIYDVSRPVPLDPKLLTPGTHVVRAFPSAGPKDEKGALHHESRKNPGAFAWVRFHVGAKGGPLADFDAGRPTLTFSRPKGEYKAGSPELAKFLVDFYVTGTTLSPITSGVRAALDGKPLGTWTEWKPWVIESPAAGAHELELELVDADGKPVDGPFNKTTRKFKVGS